MSRVPIFLINLDRSPDRLSFMQQQAERLSLAFERIRGVDGVRGLPDWLVPQFLTTDGTVASRMSNGEVGCYASHLVVFQEIVRRGLEAAIVLEDDVTLADNFLDASCKAIGAAPAGWDCIHLSTRFKNPCHTLRRLGSPHRLVRYSRLPAGSAAYAISRSGAEKLLSLGVRRRPFDMEFRYAWLANLDIVGVWPAPAVQESLHATTIDAAWRTPAKTRGVIWKRRLPKPRWGPGTLSQLWGAICVKRKLGVVGTLSCWRDEFAAAVGKAPATPPASNAT
jgi:glycosyl transferase family 25